MSETRDGIKILIFWKFTYQTIVSKQMISIFIGIVSHYILCMLNIPPISTFSPYAAFGYILYI